MTRQEQIEQAANESLPNKNKDNGFYEAFELVLIQYFIKGAKWADAHPNIDTLVELHKRDIEDVAAAYEDWNKARIKELIADACEWLEDHMGEEILVKTIEQFKKAMQ